MKEKPVVESYLIESLQKACPTIVLASASENRKQLLLDMGIEVIQKPQDIYEICGLTDPKSVVKELSKQKLDSYLKSGDFQPSLPAISLDTLVLFNSKLIGKPHSREEAKAILSSFSNKEQEVLTGLSAYLPNKGVITTYDVSKVVFEALEEDVIEWYLNTKEYIGAAGGYRIQKNGYKLVKEIKGSWTNVIGCPVEALLKLLTN